MTALAQIEETLSRLTVGELAEVQSMLARLQKCGASNSTPTSGAGHGERRDARARPTFEEIKPLLDKPELTEEELEKLVRHNGFPFLPKRPGPPVTVEMVRQLMDEEGI